MSEYNRIIKCGTPTSLEEKVTDVANSKNTRITYRCSFCGKSQDQVQRLIAGPGGVYICDECIDLCREIIDEEQATIAKPRLQTGKIPTPKKIYEQLSQYVIGQERAKKSLAVAVYNHYKRIGVGMQIDDVELGKSNILLIGPTGCGKTLLAQTLARILDVPFCIADATALTEAGYVGEDVENILLRLIQTADFDVARAERGIVYIDEIDKIVEQRIGTNKSMGFRSKASKDASDAHESILTHLIPDDSLKYCLIPEIVGRLPVAVSLDSLDKDALIRILTEPKNAIIRQYQKFLQLDRVELVFTNDALDAAAEGAMKQRTGARGLRSIIEDVLLDVMYEIPSRGDVKKVIINADVITAHNKPLLETRSNRTTAYPEDESA